MEKGDAFTREMRVIPACDGSFIVTCDEKPYAGLAGDHFAFTNVSDLLDWLVSHAQAFSADKIADRVTHELTEADVVKAPRGLAMMMDHVLKDIGKEVLTPGLRRTQAWPGARTFDQATPLGPLPTPEPPTAA